MRAEAARPLARAREPERPDVAPSGFGAALRRAGARRALERRVALEGRATQPAIESPGASAPREAPTADGPAAGPVAPGTPGAAGCVAGAAALVRLLGPAALELGLGHGVRCALAQRAEGVELRVAAPPLLERVVQADLQALGEILRRRGVRLARATLAVAAGPGAARVDGCSRQG